MKVWTLTLTKTRHQWYMLYMQNITGKILFSVIIAPTRKSCTHYHAVHLHLWWNQRINHTSMNIAMIHNCAINILHHANLLCATEIVTVLKIRSMYVCCFHCMNKNEEKSIAIFVFIGTNSLYVQHTSNKIDIVLRITLSRYFLCKLFFLLN